MIIFWLCFHTFIDFGLNSSLVSVISLRTIAPVLSWFIDEFIDDPIESWLQYWFFFHNLYTNHRANPSSSAITPKKTDKTVITPFAHEIVSFYWEFWEEDWELSRLSGLSSWTDWLINSFFFSSKIIDDDDDYYFLLFSVFTDWRFWHPKQN